MDVETTTVGDYIFDRCSQTFLAELSCTNEYWEKVSEFVLDNESQPISKLSFKQKQWLFRIKDDLLEKQGE